MVSHSKPAAPAVPVGSDDVWARVLTSMSRKDRFIAKLVSFLTRAVYQDVEAYWAGPVPPDAPQLTVSNHFAGFADGLVLLDAMPRRPGIVARDVIWKSLSPAG